MIPGLAFERDQAEGRAALHRMIVVTVSAMISVGLAVIWLVHGW